MSFSDLKRSSTATDFDFLQKELESKDSGGSGYPEFKPALNKEKTGGGAILRFLPAPAGESAPVVKLFQHVYQNQETGQWFIENCPTTLQGVGPGICPVCDSNREIYKNNPKEVAAKLAAGKSRKKKYIANVLVIKDFANPQNNGQVMQWRFGQQIFDIISRTMKPEEGMGDEPIPVFNFWKGANFRLRITLKGSYWNYESSSFEAPAALSNDDDELEKIYNQLYPLAPIVAEDQFKSYDDLERRFNDVEGRGRPASSPAVFDESFEDESEGRGGFNDPDITLGAPAPEPVSAFRSQVERNERHGIDKFTPSEVAKDADYFAGLLAD